MPDLNEKMTGCLPNSTFENPIREIDGWHIFFDSECGFIPSASNRKLVGYILAWKRGTDRHYLGCIGNPAPDGVIAYKPGGELPLDTYTQTIVEANWFVQNGESALKEEYNKTLTRLTELVCEKEGISIPV